MWRRYHRIVSDELCLIMTCFTNWCVNETIGNSVNQWTGVTLQNVPMKHELITFPICVSACHNGRQGTSQGQRHNQPVGRTYLAPSQRLAHSAIYLHQDTLEAMFQWLENIFHTVWFTNQRTVGHFLCFRLHVCAV